MPHHLTGLPLPRPLQPTLKAQLPPDTQKHSQDSLEAAVRLKSKKGAEAGAQQGST